MAMFSFPVQIVTQYGATSSLSKCQSNHVISFFAFFLVFPFLLVYNRYIIFIYLLFGRRCAMGWRVVVEGGAWVDRESCAQVYNKLSPVYFWEAKKINKYHLGVIDAHTSGFQVSLHIKTNM